MIRINLLGVPKPKKGARAPIMRMSGGPAISVAVGSLIIALVTGAGNAAYYWKLTRESERLKQNVKLAEAENRRLSEVRSRYLEREKIKDNYKRRVDVIDQLRANQAGPVNLLNMIGRTVNGTDEVWLSTMTDEGSTINLKGVALSVHAVANLLRNLKRTGYFKSVEIKETYQDAGVKDMQAFQFTLQCEKVPQKAPEQSKKQQGQTRS